jgi:hypothetical protein
MLVYNANELEGEDLLTVSLLTLLVYDIQLNVTHAPETRSRMSPWQVAGMRLDFCISLRLKLHDIKSCLDIFIPTARESAILVVLCVLRITSNFVRAGILLLLFKCGSLGCLLLLTLCCCRLQNQMLWMLLNPF